MDPLDWRTCSSDQVAELFGARNKMDIVRMKATKFDDYGRQCSEASHGGCGSQPSGNDGGGATAAEATHTGAKLAEAIDLRMRKLELIMPNLYDHGDVTPESMREAFRLQITGTEPCQTQEVLRVRRDAGENEDVSIEQEAEDSFHDAQGM